MSEDLVGRQRADQKAETRSRILAKAKELCARRGFARTRTLDVAKAARVSHGSVFVHFASREALITEVVREMAREITDALHERLAQGGSLRDVLAAHLECLSVREDQIRWLLVEMPLLPRRSSTAWIGMQAAVSHYIAEAADRDRAAGRLRPMAPHLLFNTWVGLVHHYLVNRELFSPGRGVLAEHGPALLDHFSSLVTPPQGARK